VSSLAALAALPIATCALTLLLRSPLARRLRAAPETSRWRTHATPLLGGIAIYAGVTGGIWLAVALGPLHPSKQLIGLFAGASLLFVTGLVDDLWSLGAKWKLALQLGGAGIVLATGTTVQLTHSEWIGIPLGLLWIVGMTNAFNLLDNMDGLAASLAAIAAIFFAAAAQWYQSSRLVLVFAIALAAALVAFLPFNLRPGRRALAWMGDSGSQFIGFMLGSLGLASAYTVASSTVATLVLPVIVLAIPILDTTLVTIVRLLDGRPVTQGGRDHSSHRLVALGVSETSAVILLAVVSAALGATSLVYEAFGNGRVAAIGVLITFALLVQFGSFLADVDRGGVIARRPLYVYTRRIVEVLVDGALIGASFLAAYFLRYDGVGTINQRSYFLIALPMLLFCRYIVFVLFGLYAGVRRYAGSRDAIRAAGAVVVSEVLAVGLLVLTQQPAGDFSRDVFVIDAFICTVVIIASRFAERALVRALDLVRHRDARRVMIIGAGRSGRSLLRELRETPGERVVAFVDDDPSLAGRRVSGVRVVGDISTLAGRTLGRVQPDVVLVTIPNAPRDRLDEIVRACAKLDVTCRFVRREADLDPQTVLRTTSR